MLSLGFLTHRVGMLLALKPTLQGQVNPQKGMFFLIWTVFYQQR